MIFGISYKGTPLITFILKYVLPYGKVTKFTNLYFFKYDNSLFFKQGHPFYQFASLFGIS